MPLSTDNYRHASELLDSCNAFRAHPTDKKVLTIDMNKALENRVLVDLMAQSLREDLIECYEEFGHIDKIVCLGWLSTVVATAATCIDLESNNVEDSQDAARVIADATIIGYDTASDQFVGKINLDERVLVVNDVLYGKDLDLQVKLIRAIGARGASVVAIAACLDMEQNVLQCLAGRTTNEFMVGTNVGATATDGDSNTDPVLGSYDDEEDVGEIAIIGVDIMSLSVVVSHLVSSGKLDGYMVRRIEFYVNNEYNEWLARRDAEVRAKNSRFFYQHDPVSWQYTGYLNTWNPNSSPITHKVREMLDFLVKTQKERDAKAKKAQETAEAAGKDPKHVQQDTTDYMKDAPMKLDEIPVPQLYVNPVVMDLSAVTNWGVIKHRIQTALDTVVDGSQRIVEDSNVTGDEKYEPCGNISNVILNYNVIKGWDSSKAEELYKMCKEGGFAVICHHNNVYDVYNDEKPVDMLLETVHISTVEDMKVYLEQVRRVRAVRSDNDYRHLLELRFNKYTVENVLSNADFWNMLRESVLATYASRTYHIAGIIFDYEDFAEVDHVPTLPKHFDLDYMVPVFFRTTGYYHHKSVVYGPKTNSDKDYITAWEKMQSVLDKLGCTGLIVGDDLVNPNVPFDKKWIMYYKLLKKIRASWRLIEKLKEWQYIAPLRNEDSSTDQDDTVTATDEATNNDCDMANDDYEEDPDEVLNADGQTVDEARAAKEDETKTKENMPINIAATIISMNNRRQKSYEYFVNSLKKNIVPTVDAEPCVTDPVKNVEIAESSADVETS